MPNGFLFWIVFPFFLGSPGKQRIVLSSHYRRSKPPVAISQPLYRLISGG